jgi:hypothetical protein
MRFTSAVVTAHLKSPNMLVGFLLLIFTSWAVGAPAVVSDYNMRGTFPPAAPVLHKGLNGSSAASRQMTGSTCPGRVLVVLDASICTTDYIQGVEYDAALMDGRLTLAKWTFIEGADSTVMVVGEVVLYASTTYAIPPLRVSGVLGNDETVLSLAWESEGGSGSNVLSWSPFPSAVPGERTSLPQSPRLYLHV